MNTQNEITISVIKNETGRQNTNIAQWIQFFNVTPPPNYSYL